MSEIIVNSEISNISIIIDDKITNLLPYRNLLNNLEKNYKKIDDATNNIISNSSTYLNLEEVDEVNFIQTLTGKLIETVEEMDTLQQDFTANWQNVSNYIAEGVIDAGYF
jgi:hypothetical protein